MLRNMAEATAARLRETNHVTVATLERELELGLGLAYTVVVPFQELVARGAQQSSLHGFLVGPRSTFWASLASNAMFTTSHLYLSVTFALLALPAGLFRGWIYARQRTLVGVTVSHVLIGLWVFSVLGIEGLLLA